MAAILFLEGEGKNELGKKQAIIDAYGKLPDVQSSGTGYAGLALLYHF